MRGPAPPQTSREGPDPVSCGAPPLWSLANHKPVLEALPPHGTPPTGSLLPWSPAPRSPAPTESRRIEPRPHRVPTHGPRPTEPRPHGAPPPRSPTPTEPRPHGAPPPRSPAWYRAAHPRGPGDLEARAFLKKLLEQSKTSSLVPTPRSISPTCPANPLSLLRWVNLVPCSGDAQLQRQREKGSMRCGVSAPIPSG